jgi:hypothetical protein
MAKQAKEVVVTSEEGGTITTSPNTSTISINVSLVKELYISIPESDGVPRYKFTGTWTGRDVSTITRLLHRAYVRHNQALKQNRLT